MINLLTFNNLNYTSKTNPKQEICQIENLFILNTIFLLNLLAQILIF